MTPHLETIETVGDGIDEARVKERGDARVASSGA